MPRRRGVATVLVRRRQRSLRSWRLVGRAMSACSRICRSRACRAGTGSRPSSSASMVRARRSAASASAWRCERYSASASSRQRSSRSGSVSSKVWMSGTTRLDSPSSESGRDQLLLTDRAQLGEPLRLRPGPVLVGEVEQRSTSPQRERSAKDRGPLGRVGDCRQTWFIALLERPRVDGVVAELQRVTLRLTDDHVTAAAGGGSRARGRGAGARRRPEAQPGRCAAAGRARARRSSRSAVTC